MDLMQTELGRLLNRSRTLSTRYLWQLVFRDYRLKQLVLWWIQQDQLYKKGIDENGKVIGTYSEVTEMINPKKVAGTHYTLFDTGEFYDSMKVVVLNDSIVIEANPKKTEETEFGFDVVNLFEEYGEGIIGLTTENKQKLANEVSRRFRIELNKIL
jgi:hypothetical protein